MAWIFYAKAGIFYLDTTQPGKLLPATAPDTSDVRELRVVVTASQMQSTTSTTSAQYGLSIATTGVPDSVTTNANIHLTFSVSWSNLQTDWYLLVGLMNVQNNTVVLSATVIGNPIPCYHLSTGGQTPGTCFIQVPQSSGTENLAFDFLAPSIPQTLQLDALGVVFSSITTPDMRHALWTNVSPKFSVIVVNPSVQTTTSSLPMTQSPQLVTISPNNISQLALVGAAIATVALAALIISNRLGGRPRSMKGKKVDSKTKKLTSSNNFCIECGNKLPSKSKFCNNCGTKQP
jgi:hypothetical protein